jgi:small subunit ribosomal protein S6
MKKYEIMAIIANNLDEKEAKTAADESLKKRITNLKGEITFEDFWGAKGFAYKIEGEKWGYYAVYQFNIDGATLSELERELNIDKNIVRFLVTKVEKDMPKPIKYIDMKKTETLKDVVKEDKPEKPAKIEKKEEPKTVKPKTVAKKEEKIVNKDEVDKKLDAILDDASLGL